MNLNFCMTSVIPQLFVHLCRTDSGFSLRLRQVFVRIWFLVKRTGGCGRSRSSLGAWGVAVLRVATTLFHQLERHPKLVKGPIGFAGSGIWLILRCGMRESWGELARCEVWTVDGAMNHKSNVSDTYNTFKGPRLSFCGISQLGCLGVVIWPCASSPSRLHLPAGVSFAQFYLMLARRPRRICPVLRPRHFLWLWIAGISSHLMEHSFVRQEHKADEQTLKDIITTVRPRLNKDDGCSHTAHDQTALDSDLALMTAMRVH